MVWIGADYSKRHVDAGGYRYTQAEIDAATRRGVALPGTTPPPSRGTAGEIQAALERDAGLTVRGFQVRNGRPGFVLIELVMRDGATVPDTRIACINAHHAAAPAIAAGMQIDIAGVLAGRIVARYENREWWPPPEYGT